MHNPDPNQESSHPGEMIPVDASDPPRQVANSEGELPLEDQATVISKRPPLPGPLGRGARPHELRGLLEGKLLAHFQLEEFVGGGGMGAVFRATDTQLGRTVAVKVISGNQTDEDTLRRFHNEAQSAARLDHRNIARVYYVGEDNGWHYIVFEFIEGVNIRDLVDHKGPLSLDEAVNYALQVAEALDHAHRREVVHRDIKPSNVLVMPDGVVKLVDMGLARLHHVESTDDITASGVTLGTFDYISPEQARDPRSADVRSDLYSLGCTLYFMLTGQPPFPQGTVLQKLLSHSGDEPPDPRIARPELDESVTRILHRLLAKQPADRFQEPHGLINDLLLMADKLNLSVKGRADYWVRRTKQTPHLLLRLAPILAPLLLLVSFAFASEWMADGVEVAPALPHLPESPREAPREADASPATGSPKRQGEATGEDPRIDPGARQAPPEKPVPPTRQAASNDTREGQTPLPMNNSPATEQNAIRPPGEGASAAAAEEQSAALTLSGSGGASVGAADAKTSDSEAATTVHKIIVSPKPLASPPPGARVAASLAAASQWAAESPDVSTIELRFDGASQQTPLRLVLDRPLTIRAADGFNPILVFRPELTGFAPAQRMIEIIGGDVTIRGIHFHLDLPSDPSDRWALFHLNRIQSLDFQRCTLTIHNVDVAGSPLQQQVAFLEYQGAESRPDSMMSDDNPPPPKPSLRMINLTETLARGQATFLRITRAEPMSIHWTQGLLFVSGRLLESTGPAAYPDSHLQLVMNDLTAVCDQGLALIDMGEKTERMPELHVTSNNGVFATRNSAPLLEHRNVDNLMQAERRLSVSGTGNFYSDEISIRWRIVVRGGEVQDHLFDLSKDAPWYQEVRGLKPVMWNRSWPADMPLSKRGKSMYLQDERPGNPTSSSGFNKDLTPDFPDPQIDPRGATSSSPSNGNEEE